MIFKSINESFESKYNLDSNDLSERLTDQATEFDNFDDSLDEGIWDHIHDRIQNRKIDTAMNQEERTQAKAQAQRNKFSERDAYNKEYARVLSQPGMDEGTAKKIMKLWKSDELSQARALEAQVAKRYQYMKKKGMVNDTSNTDSSPEANKEEQQHTNKGLNGKPASTTTGLGDYNTDFPTPSKSSAVKAETPKSGPKAAPKELDKEDILSAVNDALMQNKDIARKLTFDDRQAIEDSVRQYLKAVMNANIQSAK